MAEKKSRSSQEYETVDLVRVLGKDIRGDLKVITGLTKIKGISWAFSNAICKVLDIDSNKDVSQMSEEEIKKISEFMKEVNLPSFLKNRQKDYYDKGDHHFYGSDLTLKSEFDIKRLRKVHSYRGLRHANKLPVRGQRTKSNFRSNKKRTGATGARKK